VELAEGRAVSAVWDLLDRPLGVRLLLGSDTPESEEDESSSRSLVLTHHESAVAGVVVVTYSDFRSSG